MGKSSTTHNWEPIGIEELESNAMNVVTSNSNSFVIAGPGAGKTELLAQRACYLLQTGNCPAPKRILAISFKKDAARNLKERVKLRATASEASRFDSYTFSAFAKQILDRFSTALPADWTISRNYQIQNSFSRRAFEDVLSQYGVHDLRTGVFFKSYILGSPLLNYNQLPNHPYWEAAKFWWKSNRENEAGSILDFSMISRLAELIVQSNPLIKKAVKQTYQHVFLDEFQDTTHVQYDLVKAIFLDSQTILTAVGDNKQQIMRWAMALPDSFGNFSKDFNAQKIELIRNYRSSEALVTIQNTLSKAVDSQSHEAQAMVEKNISEDACSIAEFSSPEQEALFIAKEVKKSIEENNLTPRDYAILLKQTVANFTPPISTAFNQVGLKARDESSLQDILTEPLTRIVIPFMRLASSNTNRHVYWSQLVEVINRIKLGEEDLEASTTLQKEIDAFISTLKPNYISKEKNFEEIQARLNEVINFLGIETIKAATPEYKQGTRFEELRNELANQLVIQGQTSSTWEETLDSFEGHDSTPLMTIHKSKGLEFHTVFFVGLEDQTWWSIRSQPEEAKSAFFVAFSRAKQRVVFTYCNTRSQRYDVAGLYELLQNSGVPVIQPSSTSKL